MKIFIDTDWYEMIQDLSIEQQNEIMHAILSFPYGDSSTHIWKKIIRPQLEKSAQLYQEKSQRFAENRKKRWQHKSKQMSEQICEQISEQKSEQISNRYQNVNVNVNAYVKENIKENNISLSGIRAREKQNLDLGEYSVLQEQVFQWLEYKKSRKETYKAPNGPKMFAKKLWELSNGNPETATAIIEQSMANNWAGVFALKNSPPSDKRNIDDPEHFVI